jgi:hypothetical protein
MTGATKSFAPGDWEGVCFLLWGEPGGLNAGVVSNRGSTPGWFSFVGGCIRGIWDERWGFSPPRRQRVRWFARLGALSLVSARRGTPVRGALRCLGHRWWPLQTLLLLRRGCSLPICQRRQSRSTLLRPGYGHPGLSYLRERAHPCEGRCGASGIAGGLSRLCFNEDRGFPHLPRVGR